jgi:hypothetical protein
MDRDILITVGFLAGVILVYKLAFSKQSTSQQAASIKNFTTSKNMPEHLKPPQLLFEGEPIIVTERPLSLYDLGISRGFM